MSISIIIPARFGSSRYRGKPLVKILNREMVLRVADICSKVVDKKKLFIATDSKKISKVVKKAKYNVVMTTSKCLTGTDRVAEASKKIISDVFAKFLTYSVESLPIFVPLIINFILLSSIHFLK